MIEFSQDRSEPRPICGETRGPRSHTRCELPPDHILNKDFGHLGRSPSGKWFSWPLETANPRPEGRGSVD
jgi:hypothetical protein